MKETDKIQILKDILFEDDTVYLERMSRRLEQLENTLNERQKLSSKVDPLIIHQINEFKESIPTTLGPTITATLKSEIEHHKDDVIDALFPIIGKMIKKYVEQEIKQLSEKINSQLGFSGRIKSIFGSSKEKKELIDDLIAPTIEQVLLIEKQSGLLRSSFSTTQTIDEEMISGMLTAIKSFVEDAFGQKNQSLELIDYELYHIHLQSFSRYYLAVVLSGSYTLDAKDKIQDLIFNFYEDFTQNDYYLSLDPESLNQKIAESFQNADL